MYSVEVMTPTLDTFQFPGSLLKKFQNLKLRYRDKSSIPTEKNINLKWDGDKLLNYTSCDYWLYSVMVYVLFVNKTKGFDEETCICSHLCLMLFLHATERPMICFVQNVKARNGQK